MERKESNMQTLETLYKQYADLVLKVCYDNCGDYETARNITQEVFLTLISEIDNIDTNKVVKWLMITARNKTLNSVRRQKYEVLTEDVTKIIDSANTRESAEETVLRMLEEADRSEREQKMLRALYGKNERWYDAVTLTYYQEYPQVKTAEKLEITTNALYALMNRARRWIKEYYERLSKDILQF